MEETSCSKSLTLTKWHKYPLDNILLSLRLETIWVSGDSILGQEGIHGTINQQATKCLSNFKVYSLMTYPMM